MNSAKTIIANGTVDHLPVINIENAFLRVVLSPNNGGRIISLYNKVLQREFLWRNSYLPLAKVAPGAPYDPNFYGGIDEVIPCDVPETIGGLPGPDHGELWTLPLTAQVEGESLWLQGTLPIWGLRYRKRVTLQQDGPALNLHYQIENHSDEQRAFLWKLHAAIAISAGDRLVCRAQQAVVADIPWSRWKTEAPFQWPEISRERADLIPPPDGTTDFLFLYDLTGGSVSLHQGTSRSQFTITFDRKIFPYVCYFASYGGFEGHYTAVLEPCTAMPVSVNEALRLGQCTTVLDPGQVLETSLSIFAGPA